MQTLQHFARIQTNPFTQHIFDRIQHFPECGGIGIFIGAVRNHHQAKAVQALKYTAYAPVAEKMIRQIEQQIEQKYGVPYVRVVHRVGVLDIGETAIIAIAYAAHRREAFQACEEAVERVKHQVPVWKEEFYCDGTSQYVEGCCIRRDLDPHSGQDSHLGQDQHLDQSQRHSIDQHQSSSHHPDRKHCEHKTDRHADESHQHTFQP